MQYVFAILWVMYICHAVRLAERLHALTAAAQADGKPEAIDATRARPRWGPLKHLGPWVAQWTTQGEAQLEAPADSRKSRMPVAA